jgi:hypothetical protein
MARNTRRLTYRQRQERTIRRAAYLQLATVALGVLAVGWTAYKVDQAQGVSVEQSLAMNGL